MDALRAEYGALESDLALAWAPAAHAPAAALDPADGSKVLALLLTLPHSVVKYSHAVPGGWSAHNVGVGASATQVLPALRAPAGLKRGNKLSCTGAWTL